MTGTHSIRLHPEDLCLHGGFADGRLLTTALDDWCATSWVSSHDRDGDQPVNWRIDETALLGAVLKDALAHVVKALPPGVHVCCDQTTDNPFLLATAGGTRITVDMEPIPGTPEDRTLSLLTSMPPVDVTVAHVHATADLVFPHRHAGWLKLLHRLRISPVLSLGARIPDDSFRSTAALSLARVVDGYAARLSDEALGLAADLLTGRLSDLGNAAMSDLRTIARPADLSLVLTAEQSQTGILVDECMTVAATALHQDAPPALHALCSQAASSAWPPARTQPAPTVN